MSKDLEQMLQWANTTYYPFKWVIEGPYLYISNYGMDACKSDGMAWFPRIEGIKDTEYFIKEAKKYISNQSEFFLTEPSNRKIKVEFNNEKELEEARKLHYENYEN